MVPGRRPGFGSHAVNDNTSEARNLELTPHLSTWSPIAAMPAGDWDMNDPRHPIRTRLEPAGGTAQLVLCRAQIQQYTLIPAAAWVYEVSRVVTHLAELLDR